MKLGSVMQLKFCWIMATRSRLVRCCLGLAFALVLAGCSLLRLGYSQGPTFVYWWIDGYADLSGEQSLKLRESIDRWFEWHRRVEMPRYAALLARAQREVMEPTLSTAQLCFWRDEAQRRLDAALDEASPALATLAASLAPEQIGHMQRKLAKDGEELKREFAQADKAERAKVSFKRTLERYENLYGALDEAQRAKLGQLLAASPFDADRWIAERERRNRDLLAALTKVSAGGRAAEAQGAVRQFAEQALRSPRSEYRAYQEKLTQENCGLAAAMHNATTPAQRQHARDKLKGWEEDVRLIAAAPGNGNGGVSGEPKPRSP
jgi:Family of unknown function (DUF6279)